MGYDFIYLVLCVTDKKPLQRRLERPITWQFHSDRDFADDLRDNFDRPGSCDHLDNFARHGNSAHLGRFARV